jgi:hypothetical protein
VSNIVLSINIPLDNDHYLRRECPNCMREFKIQVSSEELKNIANRGIQSYLTNDETTVTLDEVSDEKDVKCFCPYCGQEAPNTSLWTKEQLAYMNIFGKNIMAKLVNDNLINPLKKGFNQSSGMISMSFKGEEMKYEEPWISEEPNDMNVFELPCCHKSIKVVEDWKKSVFCFYCGFEHIR